MAPALVEVQRDLGGVRDFLRSYQVVIDEEVVGHLDVGHSQTFEVPPGAHEIYLKISWCRSEKITTDVKAGQTVAFRCAPNGRPFTEFYWISFGRHRYIDLSKVGS